MGLECIYDGGRSLCQVGDFALLHADSFRGLEEESDSRHPLCKRHVKGKCSSSLFFLLDFEELFEQTDD